MSERGVFAVDRGIWDHDLLVENLPFSRREAWLWIVSEAAWKPHRRRVSGRVFELERGQLVASLRYLAAKWRWSEPRVRRFLAALISDAMVDAQTDAGVTVLTVCKYTEYQRISLPSDAIRKQEPDAGATQERRNKEDKEIHGRKDNSKELSRDEAIAVLSPPLSREIATEVVAYRKRRKQPNTMLALKRLSSQFGQYEDPDDGAAEMITRGWSGFSPSYMDNLNRGTGPPKTRTQEATERFLIESGVTDGNR